MIFLSWEVVVLLQRMKKDRGSSVYDPRLNLFSRSDTK
ncbi:hypothetical protein CSC13_2613 [Klebsiella pneumoniae]|nr:hypothetical protein CSC13_2613 [Klebsiella pneumoniae]